MADDAFGFQFLDMIQNTDLDQLVEVFVGIHTVQEAEVHIVGAQLFQFPEEGLFDGVKIPAPAVFAVFVIDRAEMYL